MNVKNELTHIVNNIHEMEDTALKYSNYDEFNRLILIHIAVLNYSKGGPVPMYSLTRMCAKENDNVDE
jgi:hypothetical protein